MKIETMPYFMGVKVIQAKPMSRKAYNDYRGWTMPANEDDIPGYLVVYPDGYKSWTPAGAFENAYVQLVGPAEVNLRMKRVDDTVLVSRREYDDLLKFRAELSALEAHGVNNWDGYGGAGR